MLMRGRVAAQGFTVLAMCIGGYFNIKPFAEKPKLYEEVLSEKLGKEIDVTK
jgi:hypothetical protein